MRIIHHGSISVQHTIKDELTGVLIFVGAMWVVFLLNWVLPVDLNGYGITPRTWSGLIGIPASPFLHLNLRHIVSNTVPLLVLLILLAGSKANSWGIVIAIILVSGGLLWLVGRNATHIGASGLVFGLVAFLIVSGFLEGRIVPLLIALVVGFLYGGTLLSGVVPRMHSSMSWDGHLCGAIAGGLIAYVLTRSPTPPV
jgi:membrane associated rhomboid family serine protease